jgi:putative transcriptional regulator
MKAFKKRGALTHFQILSEISKQDPHLKQKDLAQKLGITIQAVSENIKTLTELGYITSKDGRSPYKITQKGIDKVKRDAISLRKYSDSVLETMNQYKTIWPAIAAEDLEKGKIVGLYMEDGVLYAHKGDENANGIVLESAEEGSDVALTNLTGLIDMTNGEATIINLPTIKEGGSKATDLILVKDVYDNGTKNGSKIDKVAVAGTIARVVAHKLDLGIDIEYAAPQATANAARKGLNVLALCVGDMTKSFVRELEAEKIKYNIIDGRK